MRAAADGAMDAFLCYTVVSQKERRSKQHTTTYSDWREHIRVRRAPARRRLGHQITAANHSGATKWPQIRAEGQGAAGHYVATGANDLLVCRQGVFGHSRVGGVRRRWG